MSKDQNITDNYEGIASGAIVCIREASSISGISYWKLWRRLQREAIPTFRLHGRRYVPVSELTNPALRVP
jgi:hypothetical protein